MNWGTSGITGAAWRTLSAADATLGLLDETFLGTSVYRDDPMLWGFEWLGVPSEYFITTLDS